MGIVTLVLREAAYLQRPYPELNKYSRAVGFLEMGTQPLTPEQRICGLPILIPGLCLSNSYNAPKLRVVINADTTIKIIGFKMGFVSNKSLLCDKGNISFAIPQIR
jgi:hypothetical protein